MSERLLDPHGGIIDEWGELVQLWVQRFSRRGVEVRTSRRASRGCYLVQKPSLMSDLSWIRSSSSQT